VVKQLNAPEAKYTMYCYVELGRARPFSRHGIRQAADGIDLKAVFID
jgi:hypothetical protein